MNTWFRKFLFPIVTLIDLFAVYTACTWPFRVQALHYGVSVIASVIGISILIPAVRDSIKAWKE